MRQTKNQLFAKFGVIRRWMIEDTKRAMFDAKANFLVAQGLINYTEIVGSFINGSGKDCGENFDVFFKRLGKQYEELLKNHHKRKKRPHVIYDDLRCGLTHEYFVKRKGFVIYGTDRFMSNEEIINTKQVKLGNKIIQINCGINYYKESGKNDYWLIINPLYWLDFKNAVHNYWLKVVEGKDKVLTKNFIKRAYEINLRNFNI